MKVYLLARANLRDARSQIVVLSALIVLAAAIMNLWLMLATDYRANFDRYHEKLGAEHVLMLIGMPESEVKADLSDELAADGDVTQMELESVVAAECSFPYGDGEMSNVVAMLNADAVKTRQIGKIEIVEEDPAVASGIYLPMIYAPVGSTITMEIGGHTVTYPVKGTINSIMAGSHNCSIIEMLLTEDLYNELKLDGWGIDATLCSFRIQNPAGSREAESRLTNLTTAQYPGTLLLSTSYDQVSQSRYISQMICAGILNAAAYFVLLIGIVITTSNIVNHIQRTMPALGILKGLGYTGSDLVRGIVMQYSLVALPAAFVGTGIAALVFPQLSKLMDAQTGIPYAIHFLPGPFFLTILSCWSVVALSAWLAARRIQKIEPMTALRQGARTHDFRRNRVPLLQTKLPLDAALAFKDSASSARRNLTICATMMVLTLLIVFACVAIRNIFVDRTPILNLVGLEPADLELTVTAEAETALQAFLTHDARIEDAFLYKTVRISQTGGTSLYGVICDDFASLANQTWVAEGRAPKYDNEVAVGAKYARENDLSIGDTIRLEESGGSAEFLITGLSQSTNYLGQDAPMTRAAFERISTLSEPTYYVRLMPDASKEEFLEDAKAAAGAENLTSADIGTIIETTTAVYVEVMRVLVWVIVALAIVLTTLVVFLLVRSTLTAKNQDYGILKALGYTSSQLIRQTVFSFLPILAISEIAGLVLWSSVINPLIALFLRGIGTVRCDFELPTVLVAAAGAGLLLLALGLVTLLSGNIRKLAPKELLTQE